MWSLSGRAGLRPASRRLRLRPGRDLRRHTGSAPRAQLAPPLLRLLLPDAQEPEYVDRDAEDADTEEAEEAEAEGLMLHGQAPHMVDWMV